MIVPTNSSIFIDVFREIKAIAHYQSFDLSIIIDKYNEKIVDYYQALLNQDVSALCLQAQIPYALAFKNFGLVINFTKACQLNLHSEDMVLDEFLKKLVKHFGVVIFRNAYLSASIKERYHLNNFPHLNFHRDRGDSHENRYSFYTRDPFHKEQQYPRKASTLFIDNAVAYLQACVEQGIGEDEVGRRGHYNIFENEGKEKALFGRIILEQPWTEPEGIGEICMINNNSVLHSSYKHGLEPGYRIGTRYLY